MLLKKMRQDVEARTGVSQFMQLLTLGSVLTSIILGINLMLVDKSVRTQLIPAEIKGSFWVDGEHLGQEYLAEMGEFIVMKYASVTPATIDRNNTLLLRYVHPSVYGDLSVRFKAAASKLKQDAIARFFFVKEMRISEKEQAAVFIGPVETWVGDKKVALQEVKAYLVRFQFDGGNTTIKELRETTLDKPFAPPAAD